MLISRYSIFILQIFYSNPSLLIYSKLLFLLYYHSARLYNQNSSALYLHNIYIFMCMHVCVRVEYHYLIVYISR